MATTLCSFQRFFGGLRAVGCRTLTTGGDVEIPSNVAEINAAEKAQFSKNRMRDLGSRRSEVENQWVEEDPVSEVLDKADEAHVQSYDSRGSVSLQSVMQTNVPEPFTIRGKAPTHLNMPGGSINQSFKYEALDYQDAHPSRQWSSGKTVQPKGRLRVACLLHGLLYQQRIPSSCGLFYHTLSSRSSHPSLPSRIPLHAGVYGKNYYTVSECAFTNHAKRASKSFQKSIPLSVFNRIPVKGPGGEVGIRTMCSESKPKPSEDPKPLTSRQKLKQAVRDYGSTVIVFHVAISLASLGFFYVAVSSGVDMVSLLERVGIAESLKGGAVAGASTFVVAYAVHKIFAPVRIACTLTVTPILVRYMRRKGILKPPKTST